MSSWMGKPGRGYIIRHGKLLICLTMIDDSGVAAIMTHRHHIDEMVRYVKKYALARYDKPGMGWDFIVECWTDSDLATYIKDAESKQQAVAIMHDIARALGKQIQPDESIAHWRRLGDVD